jgi:predicted small metal-binding protein
VEEIRLADLAGKCPVCGGTLSAHSEHELIEKLQHHAKENHNIDMPEERAKQLIQK